MTLPLEGVRVLDLSRLYPGPLASLLLSDMGAQVIKIEDPSGDGIRKLGPLYEDGNTIKFHSLNRGKYSIVLNLKLKEHRKQFLQMLPKVNVVIESFRPQVLEKLLNINNIEELFQHNPNLIIARISAFGQNAPENLKNIPAHDMNSLARAGVFHINDIKDHTPQPLPIQAVDLLSGYTCAMQICAALYHNKGVNSSQRHGKVIDVSMYDMAVASMIMPVSEHLTTNQKISQGRDVLSGSVPCYDIYKTKDGYLSVGCLEPHFWKGFTKALGLDPKLQSFQAMFCTGERKTKLKELIEEKLKEKTAKEWEEIFAYKLKLPILELRKPEELADDELLRTRRMISTLDANMKVINPGLDYSSFLKDLNLQGRGPALGEHATLLSKL